MRKYTEKQVKWMKDNYPKMLASELLECFNLKFKTEYKLSAFKSALKRYNCICGRSGRFEKGQKSWNKGMKGLQIGVVETQFKKGNIPHNHRPVGSERVSNGYVEVKIAEPNKWRLKHQLVWEKHNGKIPDGLILQFKNNDRQDCRIENLFLLTRAEQSRVNHLGLSHLQDEQKESALLIAKLQIKTCERQRELS